MKADKQDNKIEKQVAKDIDDGAVLWTSIEDLAVIGGSAGVTDYFIFNADNDLAGRIVNFEPDRDYIVFTNLEDPQVQISYSPGDLGPSINDTLLQVDDIDYFGSPFTWDVDLVDVSIGANRVLTFQNDPFLTSTTNVWYDPYPGANVQTTATDGVADYFVFDASVVGAPSYQVPLVDKAIYNFNPQEDYIVLTHYDPNTMTQQYGAGYVDSSPRENDGAVFDGVVQINNSTNGHIAQLWAVDTGGTIPADRVLTFQDDFMLA
jgi:hypothetical protein